MQIAHWRCKFVLVFLKMESQKVQKGAKVHKKSYYEAQNEKATANWHSGVAIVDEKVCW
mgnify:CR=1 FL=1